MASLGKTFSTPETYKGPGETKIFHMASYSRIYFCNGKRSEFRMGFSWNVTEIFKKWGKRTWALAM